MIFMDRETLVSILSYDPEEDIWTWLPRPNNTAWTNKLAGKKAGSVYGNGYLYLTIFKRDYLAHRLVWLWHYGEMPKGALDHIDRNRLNNKINNLRIATKSENARNSVYRSNTSGIKGVYFDKSRNKWASIIRLDYKNHYVGRFNTLEEAADAAKEARARLHGDFANHG